MAEIIAEEMLLINAIYAQKIPILNVPTINFIATSHKNWELHLLKLWNYVP